MFSCVAGVGAKTGTGAPTKGWKVFAENALSAQLSTSSLKEKYFTKKIEKLLEFCFNCETK